MWCVCVCLGVCVSVRLGICVYVVCSLSVVLSGLRPDPSRGSPSERHGRARGMVKAAAIKTMPTERSPDMAPEAWARRAAVKTCEECRSGVCGSGSAQCEMCHEACLM